MQEWIKKILGSGKSPLNLAKQTTALIISNDEMEDIMKIIKPLAKSILIGLTAAASAVDAGMDKKNLRVW